MSLPSALDVARPQSLGYAARIEDLLLRLAPIGDQRVIIESAESVAQRINTADSPEELVSDLLPAHSLNDLTGGEGLFFAHRRSRSDRDGTRFWRSRGIDNSPVLAGETAGIRLLNDTEVVHGAAVANPICVALGGRIYYASADSVIEVTDPLDVASADTEDPITGTAALTGLVRLGDQLYASSADGIGKRSSAGVWSTLASGATDVTKLWVAKGRVLARTGGGNVLSTLDLDTGTGTTVLTTAVGTTITDVADGGTALLVSADDGVIYTLTEASGSLVASGQTKLGPFEHPTAIASAFGRVVIGAAEATAEGGSLGRIYVANLGSDQNGAYVLTDITLQWVCPCAATSHNHAPTVAVQKRDSIYVGVEGEGTTNLWRYHLATGSLTEDLQFGVESTVTAIAVVDDHLVVGIAGQAVYRQADTYVSEGWLIGPAADFFSREQKAWMQGRVEGEGVESGSVIEVAFSTSTRALASPTSAHWTVVATIYSASQLGTLFNVIGQRGVYGAIKLTLRAGAGGVATPIVQSATVWAYPQSLDLVVQIPVSVSDRIEMPNRRPFEVAGHGNELMGALMGLRGLPARLEVFNPPVVVRGVVQEVSTSSPGPGRRSSGALVTTVLFRGRISSVGQSVSGEGSLGVGELGVGMMGA